jgi:hypothetical protein
MIQGEDGEAWSSILVVGFVFALAAELVTQWKTQRSKSDSLTVSEWSPSLPTIPEDGTVSRKHNEPSTWLVSLVEVADESLGKHFRSYWHQHSQRGVSLQI